MLAANAGCSVNALSGLQIGDNSINCNSLRRYCYGLQVFSWSGFPDCRHTRHSAVRRCFFHPFRDFYAATGLCRAASNGTPDFSTPYATWASLRIIAPRITFPFLPLAARRSRNTRPHSVLLVATIAGIYNALRSDTCPALLNRLVPLTLLPDS